MKVKSIITQFIFLSITTLAVANNTPFDTLQQIETLQYQSIESTTASMPDISGLGGYAATGISELETASPYDEIVVIPEPLANSMGTANTSFPIKLPQGRKGLMPMLNIDYNSEGDNGWLGLGWDLTLPSISVDSRWGVPLFDAANETETYIYGGNQLYPVAHRSAPVARKADFQFHPRVEGDFAKIIRHGNNPKNYWWEITNTDGTKNYYGGLPETGLEKDAILTDAKGNIVQWILSKVEEVHGNFIRYYCTVQSDKGNERSKVTGHQIYPDRINYTGFKDQEGAYEVKFIRDRQLNETKRKDITIYNNLGFKQVNADLLRKIEVSMQGEIIRSYELTYTEGAFYKTLLKSIAEIDKNGEVFYQHDFDYYDEVRKEGKYQPFTGLKTWSTPTDNVRAGFINPVPFFEDKTSILGGSASNSFVGGSAATVGPIGPLASKEFTVGGNFAIGKSSAEGLVALVDINGDVLPDKVFKKNGKLFFRPNLASPNGTNGFGDIRPIKGIKTFSSIKTNITSFGFEANVTPVFAGYDNTTEKTTTEAYFSDFNGDQLIDVAIKGKVYFNRLDADGNPNFTTNSGDTPSPINTTGEVDADLIEVDQEEQATLIKENPLHDVVRIWEAPLTGTISIKGAVRLGDSPEGQNYPQKDGVQVAIQVNGFEFWRAEIKGTDFSPKSPTSVNNLTVNKGDHIYFRVQSVFDGAFDLVDWDPIITYKNENLALKDPNNKAVYKFKASEDFLLASCQSTIMPLNGKIKIAGKFQKPITSDDITLEIFRKIENNTIPVFNLHLPWDTVITELAILENIPIKDGEELIFRALSHSNIDWTSIEWLPIFQYTASDDGSSVVGASGEPIYSFCPAVDYGMFTYTLRATQPWIAADSGAIIINIPPELGTPGFLDFGNTTFSVKGKNQLIEKSVLTAFDTIPNNTNLTIQVAQGDTLFFEAHCSNLQQGNQAKNLTITVDNQPLTFGVYAKRTMEDMLFGPLYRGWGQFAYNGNGAKGILPIQEGLLKLPEVDIDEEELKDIDEDDLEDLEKIEGVENAAEADFILMYADPKTKSWRGYDDLTYITANQISSSRMGEDNILLGVSIGNSGTGASAPNLLSKSKTHSVAGGLSAGPGSLGAGHSKTTVKSLLDVLDLNGDQYPDIISTTKIQYTNPQGGLLPKAVPFAFGNHEAKSEATGGILGGSYLNSSPTNSGSSSGAGSNRRSSRVKSKTKNSGKKSQSATKSARNGAGVSGNFAVDNDHTEHSWLDINGDGLPDKVFKDGNVMINYGYSFGAKEDWGFTEIRKGVSLDYGGGAGVNWSNNSIAAGISLSRTDNHSTVGFQDVNGDGLVDHLRESDGKVYAKINTGSSFAKEVLWAGAENIDEGDATAEAVNAAFTICFPIIFVRFCVNPSTSAGQGVSRVLTQLSDIDGDGFVDFLKSKDDGQLSYKASTIGKTNLLKTVKRPLGGQIDIDYTIAGNDYGLPMSKWVMGSVTSNDGQPGDGADEVKLKITYTGGLFERHEREFYGFKTVREDQLDTQNDDKIYRSFISNYDQSNYYTKGLLTKRLTIDSEGKKYIENQSQYVLIDILTGQDLAPGLEQLPTETAFPALVATQDFYYEGDSIAQLSHTHHYEYDLFGNVIKTTDFGNGQPEDVLIVETTYHNVENKYIKVVPETEKMYGGTTLLRSRITKIDEFGEITENQYLLEDGTMAIQNTEFDEYGNTIKKIRPENHKGERLTRTYEYDEVVHTYLTKTEDSYGYISETKFDYQFGNAIEEVGINGLSYLYELDDRGRVMSITRPFETVAGQGYSIAYEYVTVAATPYAIAKHFDPEHESDILTISFYDGFGRNVQTKTSHSVFSSAGQKDLDQLQVSGEDFYDAFGRAVEVYYPILENTSQLTVYNQNEDSVTPTNKAFDVLDRPISITLPDGSVQSISYSIALDNEGNMAFKTTKIDALGTQQDEYADVRGRTIAINNHGQDGDIWSNFYYNALSESVKTTDHEGNTTEYTYDQLGRLNAINHPDEGLTTFTFDLAGNRLQKTTATIRDLISEEVGIDYRYDFERLVQIDYPKNVQNRVQLHYGGPNAEHFRIGKMWLREDATGGEEYFFNGIGDVIKTIRTVLINEGNVRTFVSEYEYDTWHRLQKIYYPDGELVDYQYNKSGHLTGMTGEKFGKTDTYIKQMSYDKFGDRVYCEFGNGATDQFSYDPERRWLSQMKSQTADKQLFMDSDFSFDEMGNLTSMVNKAAKGTIGGPARHDFAYDNLYRLTDATGLWEGEKGMEDYSLVLEYDNLHNITRKSQNHQQGGTEIKHNTFDFNYEYAHSKPHTPNAIGDRKLNFDANGNQLLTTADSTSSNYRQMLWDEENRLMTVAKNGFISRYTYDGNHERIIKSQKSVKGVFVDGNPVGRIHHSKDYTVYINPFFSATETEFTKHYFVGDNRILSKKGTGKFNNKFWFSRGLTAGNINYVLRLQQMQASLNDYYEELWIPPGPPTLTGYYGQPEYTQNPLPQPTSEEGYHNPPTGWPTPPPPADPNGPPGPPIRFGEIITNDSVKAGFGYEGFAQFKETDLFFYHANHLRSSCYMTDYSGQVRQHLEYLPFGETFVEESNFENTQSYLFNGKELDRENDLYYYGARYYDKETGLWLNVDPMAAKFPSWSPYSFSLNNPASLVDPDGQAPLQPFSSRESAVMDFAKIYNPKSFKANREYAALIYEHGVDENGKTTYAYTKPKKGTESGSNPHKTKMPKGKVAVGDVHTHGEFDSRYHDDYEEFSPEDHDGIRKDYRRAKKKGVKNYKGYMISPKGLVRENNPKGRKGEDGKVTIISNSAPASPSYIKWQKEQNQLKVPTSPNGPQRKSKKKRKPRISDSKSARPRTRN